MRLVIGLGVIGLIVLAAIKNEITYRNRIYVITAIRDYNLTHFGYEISYDVVRSYDSTLFRFWDWGRKNIVDRDTYEKIRPYLIKGGK